MVCICSEEGRQEAAARRVIAAEFLGLINDEHRRTMTSQIIYALEALYTPSWTLAGVWSDMWMLVTIESVEATVSIQSDTLEDAMVTLFLYVRNNYEMID